MDEIKIQRIWEQVSKGFIAKLTQAHSQPEKQTRTLNTQLEHKRIEPAPGT